jgi:hypothetical protein
METNEFWKRKALGDVSHASSLVHNKLYFKVYIIHPWEYGCLGSGRPLS